MNVIEEEFIEFLKAAEKLRMIQLNDPFKRKRKLENYNAISKRYKIIRRQKFGWLHEVNKCHKWTQTCDKTSKVGIDGRDCWRHGTFSHSLLKVSF